MLRGPIDGLGGRGYELPHGLSMLLDKILLHEIAAEHDVAENVVIGEQHPHATLGGNLTAKAALPHPDCHYICLPMAQCIIELRSIDLDQPHGILIETVHPQIFPD